MIFIVHRALFFLLAVAFLFWRLSSVCTDDIFVALAYDCFHVLHTAVTYFEVVDVEYMMEFVSLGSVF